MTMTDERTMADRYGPDHRIHDHPSGKPHGWGDSRTLRTAMCSCGSGVVYRYTPEGVSRKARWIEVHERCCATAVGIALDSDPLPADAGDGDAEVRWCKSYPCQGPRLGHFSVEPVERGDFFCPPGGGLAWTCGTCDNSESLEDDG